MAKESIIGKLNQYYEIKANVRYTGQHVPIRQLVTPNDPEVKEVAAILHASGDFVDNAWTFVHSFTAYAREEGDYWRTPAESLANPEALDCDDLAILLCSILRNFIPAEKVFCAVVMWTYKGETDGHMAVVIQDENGHERILESTAAPDIPVVGTYAVYALFNDQYALATKAGLDLFDLRPIVQVQGDYDRRSGVPRSDAERAVNHYGISVDEYYLHPEHYPLPERGSNLLVSSY